MRRRWLEKVLMMFVAILYILAFILFALGWKGILVSHADGPEFVVWGSVTYDNAQGPPVPGAIIHCHRVTDGGHNGAPLVRTNSEGYYKVEFEGKAKYLRVYVELPAHLEIIGNSARGPCGAWGVNLINCNIPSGQSSYNIGPLRFFVGFVPTPEPSPTATQTNTPTITPTPTVTYTPTNTPTQTNTPTVTPTPTQTSEPTSTPTGTLLPTRTPYFLPTAAPAPRATCATPLECQQQHEATGRELVALVRYMAALVTGMALALGIDLGRKK